MALLAHLALRPFLDAYHIVADRLAPMKTDSFDEVSVRIVWVGKQWELRLSPACRVQVDGAVQTALRLAHHELVDRCRCVDIAKRRQQFADRDSHGNQAGKHNRRAGPQAMSDKCGRQGRCAVQQTGQTVGAPSPGHSLNVIWNACRHRRGGTMVATTTHFPVKRPAGVHG